jgi:hypothetical protein
MLFGIKLSKRGGAPNPLRTCIKSGLNPGNEEKVCFFASFWKILVKKPWSPKAE